MQLSHLPGGSGLPGLQLRVQRRRDDDHDGSVGDGVVDHRDGGRPELGLGNGLDLCLPRLPGWNDLSPLRLRSASSRAGRSLRGARRRRELHRGYRRRVWMGRAGYRVRHHALPDGDLRSDEGDVRRRFDGKRRLWLRVRRLSSGRDLSAVHLQLLSVAAAHRLHDRRRLSCAGHRLQALSGRDDGGLPERHLRQRSLHGQLRDLPLKRGPLPGGDQPQRQKQAFTQILGAGSDAEHPHIVSGEEQSLSVVHALWQVHCPTPGPPQAQR